MPTTRVGELDLHFSDSGRGRTLLLVHGFPLDHTMWQRQMDCFAKSHRVLAPDLRGFGKSAVTPGTVTMEQVADDLAALLDELTIREPVILCGLSMGGYVAWQFWKRHAARLAGLILCDTRAAADTPKAARGRLSSAEQVEKQGPTVVVNPMLEKLFAKQTFQEQPALVEATRRVMLGASPVGIAAALRGMAARPDVTSELPRISLPALVICGEHDVISPVSEMRGIAESLPNANFVEVAGAGHMSPLEKPDVVNGAITGFLSKLGN